MWAQMFTKGKKTARNKRGKYWYTMQDEYKWDTLIIVTLFFLFKSNRKRKSKNSEHFKNILQASLERRSNNKRPILVLKGKQKVEKWRFVLFSILKLQLSLIKHVDVL